MITNELKRLEIPIFNSVVYFYRGKLEDFRDLLLKEKLPEISLNQDNADGLSFDFGCYQAVWVDQNASAATKVHELLHAVLNICDNHGIDRDDDEVLCYLLEYLVKNL